MTRFCNLSLDIKSIREKDRQTETDRQTNTDRHILTENLDNKSI